MLRIALQNAAIGNDTAGDVAVHTVVRGNLVVDAGVDGTVRTEQGVADALVQQSHVAAEIALNVVDPKDRIGEGVDVDGQLPGVEAGLNEITLQEVDTPGRELRHGVNEHLTVHDHNAHTAVVSRLRHMVQSIAGNSHIPIHLDDGLIGVAVAHLALGGNQGDVTAAVDVGLHHGAEVHVADHMSICHHHIGRGILPEEIQSVAQLVQLAAVGLVEALAGIGGENLQAAVFAVQIPLLGVAQVGHQGVIVLLGQHAHAGDAGVDHVGQSKVHQTVTAAEGDSRHVTVMGKRVQLIRIHLGENNSTHFHLCSPP